jgi:hypothetical protein
MKILKMALLVLMVSVLFFPDSLLALPSANYDSGAVINYIEQSNRVLVKTNSMKNPSGCSDGSYYYLAQTGSEKERRYRQDLRDAYISYREYVLGISPGVVFSPKIGLSGCSDGGTAGYPVIYDIWAQ